jgi:hypothetical protein
VSSITFVAATAVAAAAAIATVHNDAIATEQATSLACAQATNARKELDTLVAALNIQLTKARQSFTQWNQTYTAYEVRCAQPAAYTGTDHLSHAQAALQLSFVHARCAAVADSTAQRSAAVIQQCVDSMLALPIRVRHASAVPVPACCCTALCLHAVYMYTVQLIAAANSMHTAVTFAMDSDLRHSYVTDALQ